MTTPKDGVLGTLNEQQKGGRHEPDSLADVSTEGRDSVTNAPSLRKAAERAERVLHQIAVDIACTGQLIEWCTLAEEVRDALRAAIGVNASEQPSTPDPTTKGWFAALADARLAARKDDNNWLVSKLDEIHQHLLPAAGVTAAPAVDERDLWFAEWQLVLPQDAREAWPGGQHHDGVMVDGEPLLGEVWMAFGNHEGQLIALPEYAAASARAVGDKIMEGARREGYRGSLRERLESLGWSVRRVTLAHGVKEDLNG